MLSVWATLALFGILAFSKETALPTIVRLFLIVAALDNTIGPLQLLVVVDEPKPCRASSFWASSPNAACPARWR